MINVYSSRVLARLDLRSCCACAAAGAALYGHNAYGGLQADAPCVSPAVRREEQLGSRNSTHSSSLAIAALQQQQTQKLARHRSSSSAAVAASSTSSSSTSSKLNLTPVEEVIPSLSSRVQELSGEAAYSNENASGKVFVYSRSAVSAAASALSPNGGKSFTCRSKTAVCDSNSNASSVSRVAFELSPRQAFVDHDIYVGGQIPGPLQLNMTTRWLTRTILAACRMWGPIHSSLGDGQGQEYAHIVVPWSQLNSLSDGFAAIPVDAECTAPKPGFRYTWEFLSPFVDFVAWRATNLPLVGSFPLESMWGDLPLQFVVYAVPRGASAAGHKRHLVKDVHYLACVQLSHSPHE